MMRERIEDYLARGGKITVLSPDAVPENISHRTRFHYGGVNNNRKRYKAQRMRATAPGGGIEPRRPK